MAMDRDRNKACWPAASQSSKPQPDAPRTCRTPILLSRNLTVRITWTHEFLLLQSEAAPSERDGLNIAY